MMKKLLKKMAYDREKYEKQDKSANDVRKTWYVFMQISALFFNVTQQRVLYVFVVWLSTHWLGPGINNGNCTPITTNAQYW